MNSKFIKIIKDLKTKSPAHWESKGQKMVLELFRYTAKYVPAYKKHLKQFKINSSQIKNIKDFKTLPLIDKNIYLKKYPYHELFPHSDVTKSLTVSATSGSTGEPFYFPRGEEHDKKHDYIFEIFLKNQFEIDKKKTLVVICFGMGIWIGGILNYRTFKELGKKYPITVAPIGLHKDLIFKTIKKLGGYYDQMILVGYPPFIKDLADEATQYGVKWQDYKIRIINATEGFSEEFRDYIAKKVGMKNPINDYINIYGSVELGAMAHETALTNLIRRIAVKNKKVFKVLFPEAGRLPTLAQYHPYLTWFEEVGGELIATGHSSSIPLVRYRFFDRGGVISHNEMIEHLKNCGIDILKEAKKYKIADTILKLPFVYVYERSDFAASLVGILIYPEYIKNALQNKKIAKFVTGKFAMRTTNDKKQDQQLEVNIELKKNIKPNKKLEASLRQVITATLIKQSTEYMHLYKGSTPQYQKKLMPHILLWPSEHSLYFKGGGKQKWTIK